MAGKAIVFLFPLSENLQKLKDTITTDEAYTIYEIDSTDEYRQLVGQIGPSLTITTDLKKLAKVLSENKITFKRNANKALLLSKDKLPFAVTDKIQKLGVNDIMYEPIVPKTLLYKVSLLCKSLKMPQNASQAEDITIKAMKQADAGPEVKLDKNENKGKLLVEEIKDKNANKLDPLKGKIDNNLEIKEEEKEDSKKKLSLDINIQEEEAKKNEQHESVEDKADPKKKKASFDLDDLGGHYKGEKQELSSVEKEKKKKTKDVNFDLDIEEPEAKEKSQVEEESYKRQKDKKLQLEDEKNFDLAESSQVEEETHKRQKDKKLNLEDEKNFDLAEPSQVEEAPVKRKQDFKLKLADEEENKNELEKSQVENEKKEKNKDFDLQIEDEQEDKKKKARTEDEEILTKQHKKTEHIDSPLLEQKLKKEEEKDKPKKKNDFDLQIEEQDENNLTTSIDEVSPELRGKLKIDKVREGSELSLDLSPNAEKKKKQEKKSDFDLQLEEDEENQTSSEEAIQKKNKKKDFNLELESEEEEKKKSNDEIANKEDRQKDFSLDVESDDINDKRKADSETAHQYNRPESEKKQDNNWDYEKEEKENSNSNKDLGSITIDYSQFEEYEDNAFRNATSMKRKKKGSGSFEDVLGEEGKEVDYSGGEYRAKKKNIPKYYRDKEETSQQVTSQNEENVIAFQIAQASEDEITLVKPPIQANLRGLEYVVGAYRLQTSIVSDPRIILNYIADKLLLTHNGLASFYVLKSQQFTLAFSAHEESLEPEIYLGLSWKEYQDQNLERFINCKTPEWVDQTFESEMNEFIFPFFEGDNHLGFVVLNTFDSIKTHDDAKFVEMLIEATRSFYLMNYQLENGITLLAEQKKAKKAETNLGSKVANFFKGLFGKKAA